MDERLTALLEKAKAVTLTPEQLEAQRINTAAANGNVSDSRITVQTVQAARTIMLAAEGKPEASAS